MIARFQILMPYTIYLPSQVDLAALEAAVSGYQVRILPPQKAIADPRDFDGSSPVPLFEATRGLRPDPNRSANSQIEVDGRPALESNLLVIEFLKDEFDRRPDSQDPPVHLCLEIANDFLARIRFVLRAPQLKPLVPDRTPWCIDYLQDDGTSLDPAPPLVRARYAGAFSWTVAVVNEAAWAAAAAPESGVAPVWDALLLDAFSYLPSVEASVVLAFASLEALIDWCLEQHVAAGAMDGTLYTWIAERDDFAKQPSVTEQFDVLLKAVSGHSLKDDQRLWERFVWLRKVRNNIVHKGEPVLNGTRVDAVKAAELVTAAREIVDWVEHGLPEEKRRKLFSAGSPVSMSKLLTGAPQDIEASASESTLGELAAPLEANGTESSPKPIGE